ncbi:MAG: hypothetical protein FJ240_10025 [Nitrospira sp.]|nr:hypothetical protein [Nitrospira sp.]
MIMKRHVPFIAIALLMSLFLVTVASAAVRCVSALPVAGCPSYTTIQNAVDASGSGDTIVVTPGVYYENVTIPGSLSNLTIQGGRAVLSFGRLSVTLATPDQVVVDARPQFETCSGPAFFIDQAKNTTIKNLTVRHACSEEIYFSPSHSAYGQPPPLYSGANIFSTGDFTKIDKVNSYASQEEGVYINLMSGNQTSAAFTNSYCSTAPGGALVQNSVIIGNQGEYAVGVIANNAIIQTNSIWNNAGGGIFVEGCKPIVKANDLRQNTGYDCIHVCGGSDYAQVTGNSIYECGQTGIVAHGYDYDGFYPLVSPTISGNTIRGIGGYINLVTGTAPNILGAPIFSGPSGIFGSGISAYMVANAAISSNNIAGTFILGIALDGYNSAVSNNTLTAPGFVGICAGGMDFISAVASGNKNAGAPNVSQYQYNYGNKITGNKVEGAILVGIAAEGEGLAVSSNSVMHPAYLYLDYQYNGGRTYGQIPPQQMYSGYLIDCYSGGVIDRNTVTNSGWNGFVIHAYQCNITGNTAENITNTGFYAAIYGATMSGNTARYCGSHTLIYPEGIVEKTFQQGGPPPGIGYDSNGFDLYFVDSFVSRNTAEFNTGRGFILYTDGVNNFASNISRKNYRTGVRLEYVGGGNTEAYAGPVGVGTLNFTGNTITDNHGEGIANFGPNDGGIIKILNNTAQRNRTDICNEGDATFTGNICTQPNCNTIQPECDLEIPLPD